MAVGNSLQKANQKVGLMAYLTNDAVKQQINTIIGSSEGASFITSLVSAVNTNAMLKDCDNATLVSAAMLGHSLKLSPSPQMGFYYLVPYNDKERGKVAQFQLGYKGYIQLATRSGVYRKLNVLPIKKGELIKFDALNEEIEVNLIEDEEARENAETIGYYAMFEYLNGFKKAIYWSKEKMLSHADRYSKAFNKDTFKKIQEGKIPANELWKYSSPWYSAFNDMACKTMLRQLISRWGLMSIELEKAYTSDMAVINKDGTPTYVETADAPAEAPKTDEKPVEPEKAVESTPKKEKADNGANNAAAAALFGGNA